MQLQLKNVINSTGHRRNFMSMIFLNITYKLRRKQIEIIKQWLTNVQWYKQCLYFSFPIHVDFSIFFLQQILLCFCYDVCHSSVVTKHRIWLQCVFIMLASNQYSIFQSLTLLKFTSTSITYIEEFSECMHEPRCFWFRPLAASSVRAEIVLNCLVRITTECTINS